MTRSRSCSPQPTAAPLPAAPSRTDAVVLSTPLVPGHRRLLDLVLGAAVVGGPSAFLIGAVLTPSVHESGASTIAQNASAAPATNTAHMIAFVVASYLLPISAVSLARLAHPRRPWAATVGGLLAVVGWLPFSALAALDDLGMQMAVSPDRESFAPLLDRFTTDPVMGSYLLVYVLGHLVAYVVLGIALGRSGVVPWWSAACLVISSPLTVAAFVVPGRPMVLGEIALGLVVAGSLPAAWVTLANALRRSTPDAGR